MPAFHKYPWLLPSWAIDLHHKSRRILLDLGANAFGTSFNWFLWMHPKILLRFMPPKSIPNSSQSRTLVVVVKRGTWHGWNPPCWMWRPLPSQWMGNRIQARYSFGSNGEVQFHGTGIRTDTEIRVSVAEDFREMEYGGSRTTCEHQLKRGHACARQCRPSFAFNVYLCAFIFDCML